MGYESRAYCEVLGVSHRASLDEIKKAYKILVRKLHPDANLGNTSDENRLKEVNVAYEILCDAKKRELYDIHIAMYERSKKHPSTTPETRTQRREPPKKNSAQTPPRDPKDV